MNLLCTIQRAVGRGRRTRRTPEKLPAQPAGPAAPPYRPPGTAWRTATPHVSAQPAGPAAPPYRPRHRSQRAFTLIELLSSFTILAIIVGVLAVTLHALSDTWQQAQSRTRLLVQARAVMDQIAHDLRQALPNSITITDAPSTFGATNNAIEFLRFLPPTSSTNPLAIAAIRYGVTNQCLQYGYQPLLASASNNLSTVLWQQDTTLVEGLAALQFLPPATATELDEPLLNLTYLDVYLELLTPEDLHTAQTLAGTNQLLFVERRVLRFSQRVFLPMLNRGSLP